MKGFTLIELVVSLAIILILGSILSVQVFGLMSHSRSVACQAQLQKTTQFYQLYLIQHHRPDSDLSFIQFITLHPQFQCPHDGTYERLSHGDLICGYHSDAPDSDVFVEPENPEPTVPYLSYERAG